MAVGKCAKVLYPAKKEKKQRTNWAKKIRRALWRGKVDKALAQLEQKRGQVRRANKREARWWAVKVGALQEFAKDVFLAPSDPRT